MPADLSERLSEIRRRIWVAAETAGRDPSEVTLVAVGKTRPPEDLNCAVSCGAMHLGENRVQEGVAKKPLVANATWHLIGPLQRNKARVALDVFDVIHTVDRPELAERLQSLLEKHWPKRILPVLIEVNIGQEEQKAGVVPGLTGDLLKIVLGCDRLRMDGFMAIPPFGREPEASRPYFRELGDLREDLQHRFGVAFPHLSMGMSHDYETAVAEGPTLVRVGTALFGPRGP
jgi:pyridoxal phosphate enzyme (YggS family)